MRRWLPTRDELSAAMMNLVWYCWGASLYQEQPKWALAVGAGIWFVRAFVVLRRPHGERA